MITVFYKVYLIIQIANYYMKYYDKPIYNN